MSAIEGILNSIKIINDLEGYFAEITLGGTGMQIIIDEPDSELLLIKYWDDSYELWTLAQASAFLRDYIRKV